MDLQGYINFLFDVKTSEAPANSEYKLIHEIYLTLKNIAKYTLEGGREVDFIAAARITVPNEQKIAEIPFFNCERALQQDSLVQSNLLIREEGDSRIYCPYSAVISAFKSTYTTINQLEQQEINIRKSFPEANTDIRGPVLVTIEGIGAYFNKFLHLEANGLHDNYISVRQERSRLEDITFLPGVNAAVSCLCQGLGK